MIERLGGRARAKSPSNAPRYNLLWQVWARPEPTQQRSLMCPCSPAGLQGATRRGPDWGLAQLRLFSWILSRISCRQPQAAGRQWPVRGCNHGALSVRRAGYCRQHGLCGEQGPCP